MLKKILFCCVILNACTNKVKVETNTLEIPVMDSNEVNFLPVHIEEGQCLLITNPKADVVCIKRSEIINNIVNYDTFIMYKEKSEIDKKYYENNQKILNHQKI